MNTTLLRRKQTDKGIKETEILAVPRKENAPRYNFYEMVNYCNEQKKDITELTHAEKMKFLITKNN
ncbi:MAG: hypothetical protein ACE3JQ_05470 [Paenisporosarcina sp.]